MVETQTHFFVAVVEELQVVDENVHGEPEVSRCEDVLAHDVTEGVVLDVLQVEAGEEPPRNRDSP